MTVHFSRVGPVVGMFIVAVEVDDGDFFGSIIVVSMNAWDETHRMSINLANRSLHSCLVDI